MIKIISKFYFKIKYCSFNNLNLYYKTKLKFSRISSSKNINQKNNQNLSKSKSNKK